MAELSQTEELTDKQKIFVASYLANNYNATKAYIEAFGAAYDTARNEGCKLIANPCIKRHINAFIDEIIKDKKEISRKIVAEYSKIAFSDIGELIDIETGMVKPGNDFDTSIIESTQTDEEGDQNGKILVKRKIKLHSKLTALEGLSKYVAGFVEKKEVNIEKLDELIGSIKKI